VAWATAHRARIGLVVVLVIGLALVWWAAPAALMAHDLARTVLLLARTAVLLLAPGLALLLWLRPFDDLDALQTAALAPIVSMALFPLALFWLSKLSGRWSHLLVGALLTVAVAVIAIKLLTSRREERIQLSWPVAALVVIFAASLGVRLWQIRGIAYPAWVDSYHHTIITQVILDTGRTPINYHPYADLDSFLYHFGYHAYSAFLAWATGLPAHRAVLWGGQILNALSILSVFFLVDRLAMARNGSRDRRAALIAALIVGLVNSMPAYYVNWGRYPQLAGQVILPAALAVTAQAIRARSSGRRPILLGALLVGGLGLTHYRVVIFYLVGIIVLVAGVLLTTHARPKLWLGQAARLAALGAGALLLIAPWLPTLLHRTVDTARQVLATSDGGQADYITLDFVLGYGLNWPVLIALAAGAVWALAHARRQPLGLATLAWLGGMFYLANPVISGTPNGYLPNGTVILALYLPASVLIGLAISDGWGWAASKLSDPTAHRWLDSALGAMLTAAAIWGVRQMLTHGIEPWRYLVSNDDLTAMTWAREHTPEDALFAVGADFWLSDAVTGNDGGYWLPYVARRNTLVPPMIYLGEVDAAYVERKHDLLRRLIAADSAQALSEALAQAGADYVYLGQQRVAQPWRPLLQDERYFERVMAAGEVAIYRRR